MKDYPLISVVVPVYNISRLIERCVVSLINQTYRNLEIILVNDGSTDNSGAICDELSKRDERIKVIHKTNGGLSDARNCGIRNSTGDYISFVDGDDYVVKDAYEKIAEKIIEFDPEVVVANATKIDMDSQTGASLMKPKRIEGKLVKGIDYFAESIRDGTMAVCAWLSICRRDFLVGNNLFFKENILHEDTHWTLRMLLCAERLIYFDFKFYNYMVREGSIMTAKDKTKNGIDIINTCYELEDLFNKVSSRYHRRLINDYLLDLYLAAIYVGRLHRKNFNKILSKKFVAGKVGTVSTFLKSVLFLISPKVYYGANLVSKKLCQILISIRNGGSKISLRNSFHSDFTAVDNSDAVKIEP